MTRYSVHICMEVLCAYSKAFFLSITAISESHKVASSFLSKHQHKTHSNKGYRLLGGYKVN
jgi:DNA-binding IscR family transcriptional regulator